jgi:ComF family protein
MRPHFGIHGVTTYEGIVKEAIARFKFNGKKRLAEPLGILLVKYLSSHSNLNVNELDAIVPVPLHLSRLKQRGFNQVELLARIISRYHDLPVKAALERTRPTHPQFDLSRQQRQSNVAGAFKVTEPNGVFNKRLLLLDDIYTTGATVGECAKALKIAGAKRVEILTLSRAQEI